MVNQMADPMIIKTKIEEADVYNSSFVMVNLKNRKKISRGVIFYLCTFLVILAVLALSNSDTPSGIPENDVQSVNTAVGSVPKLISYFPIIFIVFLSLFFMFGYKWILKYNAKKHYNSNKLLQKDFTYTITSDSIKQESESSSVIMKWEDFYKATETKRVFLLFTSNSTAWILPKRYFNKVELNMFKTLIKSEKQRDR